MELPTALTVQAMAPLCQASKKELEKVLVQAFTPPPKTIWWLLQRGHNLQESVWCLPITGLAQDLD